MPDLLIELLSEEIPARMQPRARDDLRRLVTDGLVEAGLTYAGARAFSTPRRLALTVQGLSERSPTIREERRGPREGAPDKALEGFARGAGVSVADLELRREKKGAFHYAVVSREGREASAIVGEVLEAAIRGFPWPKSMRWGAGSLRWVRPLKRILCILSDEAGHRVVPIDVDGVLAGDVTEGHFLALRSEIRVTSHEDYARALRRAFVMISPEERTEAILSDARNLAFAQGFELIEDPGLLEEVTGLVEWPVALMGEVGDFGDLPAEVLRTSMKEHQKFFSVRDREGRIVRFVTIANRETEDHGATILAGNRKVLAARLTDARFFWENDLRVARAGMGEWLEKLRGVTFHARLGSQADRIERIAALAREIAPAVGADPHLAERAARVAKLDLASEMVYEFPELQGVMGRYYAEAAGEPREVAAAAREHYAPLGPSDAVPSVPVSVTVGLADKIDMLTGFWAIDEMPTGSRDPYALRRAGLGVIRLVLLNEIRFPLDTLLWNWIYVHEGSEKRLSQINPRIEELNQLGLEIDAAALGATDAAAFDAQFQAGQADVVTRLVALAKLETSELTALSNDAGEALLRARRKSKGLLDFIHDRLKIHLRDRGIRHDVIDASLAMPGSDDLTLLVRRAEALQALLDTEDGTNLVQGFRRADNILAQAEARDGVEYSYGADRRYAREAEERALFDALDAAEAAIAPAMEAERFEEAMRAMARLRGPIDAFFEAVQVNAEDGVVRRNRLNLLARIRDICSSVADLRRLEG